MNKYQESLDYLKTHAYKIVEEIDMGNNSSYFFQPMDDVDDVAKPLQELVDKATPKKPVDKREELHGMSFVCPKCGKRTYTNFTRDYCGECGQALDWS